MLHSIKQLIDRPIRAIDGVLGTTIDVYIDDYFWVLRYLVVDTGTWLSGRRVLLIPAVLGQPDWNAKNFPVALTQEQIERSPDIETDKPISRQKEQELHSFFSWNPYWNHSDIGATKGVPSPDKDFPGRSSQDNLHSESYKNPHLRSTKEIMGYHVHDLDGIAGFLDDFIINATNWEIAYIVVDGRDWPAGKKVLLRPQLIHSISWKENAVHLKLRKDSVKNCPEYQGSPMLQDGQDNLVDPSGKPKF